jgi:hypothetical protein
MTSLHVFYRDRLTHGYLDYGPPCPEGSAHRRFRPPTGPELALVGTLNLQDADVAPTGRNCAPFLMSWSAVGLTDPVVPDGSATWTMAEYRRRSRYEITVPQAVAVSGAAISPVAGREKRWRPFRALFAIANVRLGVWLPNPAWNHRDDVAAGLLGLAPGRTTRSRLRRAVLALDRRLSTPTGLSVLREAFGPISVFGPWVYVTDGGHYDNLGLLEALRRRPHHIVMLDGSGDAEDQFPTMAQAAATATMDQDVSVHFDPTPLMRGAARTPPQGSTRATATWRDGSTCTIHYIKCVLPDGLPWELTSYQLTHPGFPATQGSFEMYDEFEFEAFRLLGYELTRRADLPTPEQLGPAAPLEEGEDGEHPPVRGVVVGRERQLAEDRGDVRLDGPRAEEQLAADPDVGPALRHQPQDVQLPGGEAVQRGAPSGQRHQARHDLGVDDGAPAAHPLDGRDERGHVVHPVLEQVAQPRRAVGEQLPGPGTLRVGAEDEDAEVGVDGPELEGGPDALVRVRRREPDVEDDHVG